MNFYWRLVFVTFVVAASCFVPVELSMAGCANSMVSMSGQWAMIPVVRIEMVIHMSVEAAWTVKPLTRSDENTSLKPFRPVVPVRSAGIRSVVEIAIGTDGCCTNGDGDLGFCRRSGEKRKPNDNSEDCKIFHDAHRFHLV